MACKPFQFLVQEHEDEVGSLVGWTTDPMLINLGDTLSVRGKFVNGGAGDDCTGWMHWSQLPPGGVWFDYAEVKIAKSNNFGIRPFFPNLSGDWKLRLRLEYEGGPFYSNEIDIEVAAAGGGENESRPWDIVEGRFS